MATTYGGYEPLSPFTTAGSGSARWCFASKGGKEYILKEFLSPLSPGADMVMAPELRRKRYQRSQSFEDQKKRLYGALYAIHNDTLVPVLDFFRSDGKYYAVSERIKPPYLTGDQLLELPQEAALECLRQLTRCLMLLRDQGIVHADLKPDHLLLTPKPGGADLLRLIDFDNSFFEDSPPQSEREIAGDPVYLAPETFLCMVGRPAPITHKADVFALGVVTHLLLTGELPRFDARYAYVYEAVLDGGVLAFSPKLPVPLRALVAAMLSENAQERPVYEEVLAALSPVEERIPLTAAVAAARADRGDAMSFQPFDRSAPTADSSEPEEGQDAISPTPRVAPASRGQPAKAVNGLSKYMRPLPFD